MRQLFIVALLGVATALPAQDDLLSLLGEEEEDLVIMTDASFSLISTEMV